MRNLSSIIRTLGDIKGTFVSFFCQVSPMWSRTDFWQCRIIYTYFGFISTKSLAKFNASSGIFFRYWRIEIFNVVFYEYVLFKFFFILRSFHWLAWVAVRNKSHTFCKIIWLILPKSILVGFITNVGLLGKFHLWSFTVKKACFPHSFWTLSLIFSLDVIF